MLRLVKECSEFIGNRIVGSVKLDYTNRQMRKRDKLGFDDGQLLIFIVCRLLPVMKNALKLRYNYTD